MTRKYNVSINIAEKLASVYFKSFGKAHEHCKYCVLLAMPMDTAHYVLSAHAHNLAQYVGKGRQQASRDRICIIELSDHRYALISTLQRAGYVLYRALVVVVVVVVSTKRSDL